MNPLTASKGCQAAPHGWAFGIRLDSAPQRSLQDSAVEISRDHYRRPVNQWRIISVACEYRFEGGSLLFRLIGLREERTELREYG